MNFFLFRLKNLFLVAGFFFYFFFKLVLGWGFFSHQEVETYEHASNSVLIFRRWAPTRMLPNVISWLDVEELR